MVSRGKSSLTVDEMRSIVPDSSLVWHYLGIKEIPCFIKSPIREDNRPSFGLYTLDGDKIYFTDLATKERGGIYDLLSKMWHCSLSEVLKRVQNELIGKKGVTMNSLCPPLRTKKKSDVNVEVKVREWRKYDIDYWESYGVSLDWLKYADVYPISHKIITKNGLKSVFHADKYAYVFVEYKEGKVTLKIYQPFNKNGYKWSNTHDRSVISLWTKIPETGDNLVICSSLKDALCLWSNTGIPSIALQGEGYGMSDTAIHELKRRYKNVYILFDNDKAGIEDSAKLSEQTGFRKLSLPKFDNGKDVSDLMKQKGKEEFLNIINKVFTT